jgi:hypothetical protein
MKLIKKGREQRGWAKEFECTGIGNGGGGCGAILLVEQGDVYQTVYYNMGDCSVSNTFTCSECGVETDIKEGLPFTPRKNLGESEIGLSIGECSCHGWQ